MSGAEGCPHPTKAGFDTRYAAEIHLASYWRRNRGTGPVQAYLCRCGRWHLTSIGFTGRASARVPTPPTKPDRRRRRKRQRGGSAADQ